MLEFSGRDVEVAAQEVLHDGFFKICRFKLRHRRFEGGWSDYMSRELFLRADATCVLPYDPQRDEVVLIEQFRIGCIHDDQPWLLELVAGINEPEESPESVARREAREEANLEVGVLEPVARYWASPGGSNEQVQIYCGKVSSEGVGGIFGVKEEHEDIRVHVVAAPTAFAWVAEGKINNAATLIALQWLQIHRTELRRRW